MELAPPPADPAPSNRVPTKPPDALGPHGRSLWRRVAATYCVTPSDIELLHRICSLGDQLCRIEAALKRAPLTVRGSAGQQVINPLFAEMRAHTEQIRRLSDSLGLPDLQPTKPTRKPKSGRLVRNGIDTRRGA